MWTIPLTVVELDSFLRATADIWADEERNEFIDYIARNPETGDLIPDSGGVRKVRWKRQGMGKRGGARVIYFYYRIDEPLYLITAYAKADRSNITQNEKRTMRKLVETIKQKHSERRRRLI